MVNCRVCRLVWEAARPPAHVLASSPNGWHAKGPAEESSRVPWKTGGWEPHLTTLWMGLGPRLGWQDLPELALLGRAEGPGSSEAGCCWGHRADLAQAWEIALTVEVFLRAAQVANVASPVP